MLTLTQKEKFAIATRMRPVIIERTDGLWEYVGDVDDAMIAKEFGIPDHIVKSVRVRTFGKLYLRGPTKSKSDLERRVALLEKAFDQLDPNWKMVKL